MTRTALVEIDWQPWVLGLASQPEAVVEAVQVRHHLRRHGALVVCTRYLSLDRADTLRADPDGAGARFLPDLAPQPGDRVVTKHGRDVTQDTTLLTLLDRHGVDRVVLTGLLTEHGVAIAARSLHERGHVVEVVADACSGASAEAHERALHELVAAGVDVVGPAISHRAHEPLALERAPAPSVPAMDDDMTLGIAEVAQVTGLTKDTLRWYEREGLVPGIARGSDGRRRYTDADVRILLLLVRLRRTAMPVSQMREFVAMVAEGAASHGRRSALLQTHRERLLGQLAQLQEDIAAVDDKVAHYARLVAQGRDCDETPIDDPRTREAQRRTT